MGVGGVAVGGALVGSNVFHGFCHVAPRGMRISGLVNMLTSTSHV